MKLLLGVHLFWLLATSACAARRTVLPLTKRQCGARSLHMSRKASGELAVESTHCQS
jgi:hypothetical protein